MSMQLPMPIQTLLYGLRPIEYMSWCQRRYGDVFTVRLPVASMTVLADPAAIREVFGLDADGFRTSSAAPMLAPFVGQRSLLLLDGDHHRDERKLMVQALHGDAMGAYAEAMVDSTRRDLATWPVGTPFALHPRTQAITLDVILRLVFGADDPAKLAEFKAVLQPWLKQAGSLLVLAPFLRHELGGCSPWGRFAESRRRFDALLDVHIQERRADPHLGSRTDALSLLVPHLDDTALRDELLTMLAAGHDTSATALAWAFDLLLHHPDSLERVRSDDEEYLEAVVRETLRLRPVILEIGRTLTHDTVIGGVCYPAGVDVTASIVLAQRRVDRYEYPLLFRPERFIGRPADPSTWLPFGGGIRRCIGAAFAMMEIKTVLRTVLSETQLKPASPKLERPKRRAVTMVPARGVRVIRSCPTTRTAK